MIEFDMHRVSARKDFLHFVEEHITKDVYKGLGEDFNKWVTELNIIHNMLTRDGLIGGDSSDPFPEGLDGLKQLGEKVYLFRGENRRQRGLWIREPKNFQGWNHYRMNSIARININKKSDIPLEELLPENFEPKGEVVKEDKRPIIKFRTQEGINVYAKGSCVNFSYWYEKPWYRFTKVAGIMFDNAENELEKFLKVEKHGIHVPEIIGYYKSAAEDFLFVKEVKGINPAEAIEKHKSRLIEQDAEMLAVFCKLGFLKQDFSDCDDKVFDGNNLYIIDIEETVNLYGVHNIDFRELLLNPADDEKIREFRRFQKDFFCKILQDMIFRYKDTSWKDEPPLTPKVEDQINYIKAFFKAIGWKEPNKKTIDELTTFEEPYQTWTSYVGMMMDTD
jgi:hypothetical protein